LITIQIAVSRGDEDLRVVRMLRKRGRVGVSALPARRLSAEHPDHV